MKTVGTSILLILANVFVIFTAFSESIYQKGMLATGIAKYMFGIFIVIMSINSMFEEIFKSFNGRINRKIIYFTFIKSPVFFWWIGMLVYFFSLKLWAGHLSFMQFLSIYICMSFLIFFFQNDYFKKLNRIIDMINDDNE